MMEARMNEYYFDVYYKSKFLEQRSFIAKDEDDALQTAIDKITNEIGIQHSHTVPLEIEKDR
jgi:hypothetical protein